MQDNSLHDCSPLQPLGQQARHRMAPSPNGAFQSSSPGNPRNPENKQPVVHSTGVELGCGMPFLGFSQSSLLCFSLILLQCRCCYCFLWLLVVTEARLPSPSPSLLLLLLSSLPLFFAFRHLHSRSCRRFPPSYGVNIVFTN